MLYQGYKTTYDFAKFNTIPGFEDDTRNCIITIDMANYEQLHLAKRS